MITIEVFSNNSSPPSSLKRFFSFINVTIFSLYCLLCKWMKEGKKRTIKERNYWRKELIVKKKNLKIKEGKN